MSVTVLTDREQVPGGDLGRVMRAVTAAGAWLVLREKDLGVRSRAHLARTLDPDTRARQLIVASDTDLARHLGAAGVHLAATDPWPAPDRLVTPGGRRLITGRSCHDEDEVRAAAAGGAGYVTVSPVFASASKPGYGPTLGIAGVARLCRVAGGVPVLALGGIEQGLVAPCLAAGASGVAVMGAAMRAADPAGLVARLQAEAADAAGAGGGG